MGSKSDKIRSAILTAAKLTVASLFLSATAVGFMATAVQAEVQTSFLYRLSNFSGPVHSNWAKIDIDEERNEIYVTDTQKGDIRIFNDWGMEIYRFGDDLNRGAVLAAAPRNDGNILVLSRQAGETSIVICNYRGEPLAGLALQGFPPDFSDFFPTDMVYRQGLIYLLNNDTLRLAVTDSNGFFQRGYDLGALLEIDEKKRNVTQVGGLSVDREGRIFFTIPVLFSAFRLSTEGKLAGFGKPGSAPGRFNVVGGIVADAQGYIYVADRLKSAVLVFDKKFKFILEFGYRGRKPYNLISPNDLDLDAEGRLYVSQLANNGVSVFKITNR
jgi:DNA-binding beta-propeller fold protein YncE